MERIARRLARLGVAATATLTVLATAAPAHAGSLDGRDLFRLEFGTAYRNTAIYGKAHKPAGDKYENVYSQFSDGFDVRVLGHFVVRPASPMVREFTVGPFLAFEATRFRGKGQPNAVVIANYGDLRMTRLFSGIHARLRFGESGQGSRFFVGLEFGLGFAFYRDTHLVIDASPSGGPMFGGGLYEQSMAGTGGGALRLGWNYHLSDAVAMSTFVFLEYWRAGRPEDVKNGSLSQAHPRGLEGYALGIGLTFEFGVGWRRGRASVQPGHDRRPRLR